MTFIPNSHKYNVGDYCTNINILRRPDGRFTPGHVFIITQTQNTEDDNRTLSVCLMDKNERVVCHVDTNDIAPHHVELSELIRKYEVGDFVRLVEQLIYHVHDNIIKFPPGTIMMIADHDHSADPPWYFLIDPADPEIKVCCTSKSFIPSELRGHGR